MKIRFNNFVKFHVLELLIIFFLSFQNAKGEEFVLMNRIISWDINASDAFWTVMPDASMPSDWSFPNDYFNGQVYSRYEIISVATNTPCAVGWGLFQWKGAHQDSCGELCEIAPTIAGNGAVGYKTSSPSSWWKTQGGVDFSKIGDMQSMGPIIYSKNPGAGNGWPVGKAGQGGDPGGVTWSERHNWFPITVRVTVIAVSAGSTFSGWENYIPTPSVQKATPSYGIDFINETTDNVVLSTDEFSEFPTMYGAVGGTGQKMALTPGRDAYFRTKAGNGLRRSEIQHFDIPCRPATPAFVLDNVNHRTTTVVGSDYEYSDYADMSDVITGNGTYVTIPAGTTKYFRKKATLVSFKSKVQALSESTRLPVPHEFLIFNDIIEYPNTTDTNGFYYFYYNADMPKDWTSPEDYYNGQIYTRYELISEKTSTPVGLQFGLWQMLPPETGELHETMAVAKTLNGPGSVVTANSSPSTWWKLDGGFDYTRMDLTWHMGINPWKMDPVYGQNLQIRQENPSVWAERNTYWFPMKVHVTVVAVANGQTFSGWNNYTGIKPPVPSYTLNFTNEKTNENIPATDEYSYSPAMSPVYSGTGVALDLQPGQNVYFRTKTQGTNPVSDVQRLIVPSRPATPAYTISYDLEKTNQPVSLDDDYSTNSGMTGAIAGANSPLTLTPGTDVYFRTRGTGTSFVSGIQHLTVPSRPESPQFTIDYINRTTVESVSENILYSINNNLSNPLYGTGNQIAVEPGQDLYFKQIADVASFGSNVSHLTVPEQNYLGYSGNDTITQKKFMMYAVVVDGSSAFSLDNLQITNGTAQNLKPGNVFDVIPDSAGTVTVVIPENTTKANSFESNTITVYYDEPVIIVPTGIQDLNKDLFRVFPNPSIDRKITIEIPFANADQLDVYSIDGSIIKSIVMDRSEYQTIDLQELQKGMYLLKIRTDEGIGFQKLILE
jgi:hypothetical protein